MTEQEEKELRQWGIDLARAERLNPWEPLCVSDAFARPRPEFVLTMQGWIDLDAIRSPILECRLPANAETAPQELLMAMECFDRLPAVECTPENAIEMGRRMIMAVQDAFSMIVKMNAPKGYETAAADGNGMGLWLPIFSGLVALLHDRCKALEFPVQQAFAVLAGCKHNAGWSVMGETYASHDVPDEEAKN